MNPKTLAKSILSALAKSDGVTLATDTGKPAEPGYYAIGGMIRTFGNFNALYYSPTGTPDFDDLVATLESNWNDLQVIGHVGAWVERSGDAFDLHVDATYLIDCECHTDFTAGLNTAVWLAKKNEQCCIAHVCHTKTETLRLKENA
jgi:hypothetical protein